MVSLATGWREVIGHEWAVRLLSNAIIHDRVGHAYLFTGLEHIGKSTLARTFAQALNCEAGVEQRPCGECRACRLTGSDRHPDVKIIEPDVNDRGVKSIKIDAVRQLQAELSLSSYEGRHKVAILRRFDTATLSAANAFLKTLEEPPGHVVLILTALDGDTLLPTIISRCRRVDLRQIPAELIEETLMTGTHIKPAEANLIAHLADGRLGWAIQAHQNAALLQERRSQLESLHKALQGSTVQRFALAESIARKAETLPPLLSTWVTWWRDLILLSYGRRTGDGINNVDELELLHQLASQLPRAGILAALEQTEAAIRQLGQNANTRLVMENVLLTYPHLS